MRWIIAAVFLVGCAPEPADSVSFSGFDEAQLAVAYDVLDSWCEAVDWCPVVTLDGELHVKLDWRFERHGRRAATWGLNEGGTPLSSIGHSAFIEGPVFVQKPRDSQFVVLAHELGHEGVRGHTPLGVLSSPPVAAACVDSYAVRAWCKQQGCHQDAASTCAPGVEELLEAD